MAFLFFDNRQAVTPGTVLESDDMSFALNVIDSEHHHAHEGEVYSVHATLAITNGATTNIGLVTPAAMVNPIYGTAGYIHVTTLVSSQSRSTLSVYEGATWDSVTSAYTNYNHNRNATIPVYSNADKVLVYATVNNPTLGSTIIYLRDFQTAKNAGVELRSSQERILKASTKYVWSFTNLETTTNRVTFELTWYAH